MNPHRPTLALAAATAAAFLLAGCSSPAAPEALDPTESPLVVYLGALYGGGMSEEEQRAYAAEQDKKREESVAQCMKEQGFEYTPAEGSSTAQRGEWKPDDREWVAQWGYGATDYPGRDDDGTAEQKDDPNAAYVDSLSESDRAAYSEALYGKIDTDPDAPIPAGGTDVDWASAGCQGEAMQEMTQSDPLQSDEFTPLMQAMSQLWSDSSSWPGMSELDEEWAACMDESGHPGFATQRDAQTSIYDQLNALSAPTSTESTGPDPTAVAELKEKEIALALADLDCREKTDYQARSTKARWDVEEEFVADHKDELEAAKAAAEQARS